MRSSAHVLLLLAALAAAAPAALAAAPAPAAAQLLAAPVQLAADFYDDDPTVACGTADVVHAQLDALALPPLATATTVTVAAAVSWAARQLPEAVILSAAGLTLVLYQQAGWLAVSTAEGGLAKYALDGSTGVAQPVVVSLALDAAKGFRLCLDVACPQPAVVTGGLPAPDAAGWVSTPAAAPSALAGITLGSQTGRSMAGRVSAVWVVPVALAMDALGSGALSSTDALAAMTAAPSQLQLRLDSRAPEAPLVGSPVSFAVSATPASGSSTTGLALRLTLFGATPSECRQSGCGDVTQEFRSAGSSVQGSVTAAYPRAGRYVVRAQASDCAGGWASSDFEVLVRKRGDVARAAPCCRSTALIIAQSLGRPIDPAAFRPAWLNASAAAVGWDWSYLTGLEDLEAERLFDFGLLAPVNAGAWRLLSCADRHLAGLASPRVYGVDPPSVGGLNSGSQLGRNKRVAILPQGFSWAPAATGWSQQLPTCVTHWTPWVASSPYKGTSGSVPCSFACTPDGAQQLVSMAGTFDRWAEAIIEATYGQLSLLAQPVVLPTLDMPQGAAAGQNAFTYTAAPIHQHLASLGLTASDFHTILVLSPRPAFINPGYTAWADAGGSPYIYVQRCNPQHYYLLHEIGHRLGMPHATLHKLTDASAAVPPTTRLLSEGVMEDAYADRLDIMACCRGDYGLHDRILAGWVPGSERAYLGLADLGAAGGGGPVVRRYTLWPFDRPESKGQLKGVTLRLEDSKVLVLGFRSLPSWPDVRIGRDSSGAARARPVAGEHMRTNLVGLSVEYVKRGSSGWSARGLLDFNMAFARWPSALPPKPGTLPPDPPGAAFTLLREGDAWLDEDHNLLLAVERVAPCRPDAPLPAPVHRYSVFNFYGFRGESPGQEQVKRADYTGYAADLACLQLRVVSGVAAAPGTLDARVRMQGLDDQNRLVLGGSQCGFPVRPRLRLLLPDGVRPLAIVWRDNRNATVALDATEVELPALAALAEASAADTEACNTGCDWRYHVKVLASDGAQTQADIAIGGVSLSSLSMTVTYTYYLRASLLSAVEFHAIPVLPMRASRPGAAEGRSLLAQPASLATPQWFGADLLPDFSCTSPSPQWSVSLNLLVPAAAFLTAGTTQLLAVLSTSQPGAGGDLAWPGVALKVAPVGVSLVVTWGANSREQPVSLQPNSDGWAAGHLAVVRDGDRLGVWLDSNGSFFVSDVWCWPDSAAVSYCSRARVLQQPDTTFRALRLGDAAGTRGISVSSARAYNFALPRRSLAAESSCDDDVTCGSFLVAGWEPPEAASVPSGAVSMPATPPAVASTPIALRRTSFYLLVGPWSVCSSRCGGGGYASRDVRCMRLGATASAPSVEVPLADCPIGDIPTTTKRCNTVACPSHAFQLLAGSHSGCGAGCRLRPSASDGAQLVCLNSLGQPRALSQCCKLCDSADAARIAWVTSLSALAQQAPVGTLGTAVRQLTAPAEANASLHDVLVGGQLGSTCSAAGGQCSVSWQLGGWANCSASCGGGSASRSPSSCVDQASGTAVPDSRCIEAAGAVPGQLLATSCNTQQCTTFAWQVGSWSACAGDAAFGYASRAVSCADVRTGAAVSDASCAPPRPESAAVCLTPSTLSACRPSFVAPATYRSQDCFGHGICIPTGCACKQRWHGAFCEVPAACAGVMDRAGRCCSSGALDAAGACCEAGTLDAAGQCCAAGAVDVCGVCGGSSWAVDVRGVCCAGLLDASGACCASGALDECGVCDGSGGSCGLHMRLLLALPGSDISGASAAVQSLLQDVLRQAGRAEAAAQLQLAAVNASLVPAPTRRLQAAATAGATCQPPALADSVVGSCSSGHRQLRQQAAGSSSSSQAALVDVTLSPAQLAQLAASGGNATGLSLGLTGVGQLLAAGLERSAASTAAGLQPGLLRVVVAERLGVCGNGVCEVGERELLNDGGDVLHAAAVPCAQDCPSRVMICPAPVGPVGNSSLECGGNGRCLRALGTCACFDGYAGDACDECLAGFWPHRRACRRQFIAGRTIFDPLPPDARLGPLEIALIVLGIAVAAAILASMAWSAWRWHAHGKLPAPLGAVLQHCLPPGGTSGKGAAAGSKKHLLKEELELPPDAWGGGAQSPALRHRAVGATSDGSGMLKAVSLHASSSGSAAASPGASARSWRPSIDDSGDGSGASSWRGSASGASPLGRVLSGAVHRLSEAGQGVLAALSRGASASLSGYERVGDAEEGDDALPQLASPRQQQGADHGGRRSRLGADPQPHAAASQTKPQGLHVLAGPHAGWPPGSPGTARPAPLLAALHGSSSAGPVAAHGGSMLLWPPGLARIKTRTAHPSSPGAEAAAAATASAGGTDTISSGGSVLGSASSRWRTRADYQASLAEAHDPVLAPHIAHELRERRSPSEPGLAHKSRVRGRAGLEFVETPTADPNNRNAVEAFGRRAELWFSPRNVSSSSGNAASSDGSSGAWSGDGSSSGGAVLEQLAALRARRAAAQQHAAGGAAHASTEHQRAATNERQQHQ